MRSRRLSFAFFAVASLVLCSDLFAGTWELFRGPGSRGVAENQNLPVKFDPKSAVWKTAVPGGSNSSPIVWNDQLFLLTANGSGIESVLICLEAKTGTKSWEKSFAGRNAKMHKKN